MKSSSKINRNLAGILRSVVCAVAAHIGCLAPPAAAQDPPDPPAQVEPTDASAPSADLPISKLQVSLRPKAKATLVKDLENWLGALQQHIVKVGEIELQLMDLGEDEEAAADLGADLIDLRTEEVELVERTKVVAAALEAKGGDVVEANQYIEAVSGLDASADSTSRVAAVVASVKAWTRSPDGGQALIKRIALATAILIVFWVLSRFAGRLVAKGLARRRRVSNLLANFAKRTAGGLAFFVGMLMALAALGVEIGPLLAAMGAGGFIVGFALQETLGNFASGLMIMIYRPFDVKDYVSLAGVEGVVQELSLVSTTLLSFDNKVLIIPNKAAWGGTITNYTGRDLRRVDLEFGIGYEDNLRRAIEVLKEVAAGHPLVLDEPVPRVEVVALADSSVNLCCRPWVKTADYWEVYWGLMREVKLRLDEEGISIPFPQRDVHLIGANAS